MTYKPLDTLQKLTKLHQILTRDNPYYINLTPQNTKDLYIN